MQRTISAQRTARRAGLEAVLHVLSNACEVEVDEESIGRAAREVVGAEPFEQLVDAGSTIGLRVRPLHAGARDVLHYARTDLPVVTWLEEVDDWLVCDDYRLGRVRTWRSGDPRGPRWEVASRVAGGNARLWGFVEPGLPASALAAKRDEKDAPSPMRRLYRLLAVERQDLLVVVLYAVASGVLALATPVAVQVLINWLAFGAFLQPIMLLLVGLLVCLVLVAVLQGMQRWIMEIVQRRIFVRVVSDLGERLLRARVDAFDKNYGPELVNRFFDVFTVQKAVGALVFDGFTAGLQAGVGLLLLALYHPVLMAFDLVIVAGLILVLLLGRGAKSTAIKQSKVKYEVAGWLEEIARHPGVFKLGGENLAVDRTDRLARRYLSARDDHFRIFFRQYVGIHVVQVVVNVALLAVCGSLVLQGELTLGQLVAAEFIVASALAGFVKFAEKLDTIYDLFAGVDKLGTLVDLPQDRRNGVSPPASTKPVAVSLTAASFRYEGSDIGVGPCNLEVEPGERLLVFGPPGSGKSTLADLLTGVRDPTSGAVLRDGRDLTVLRPQRIYAEVEIARTGGIVQASIRDNLTLGIDLPEDEIWTVLEKTGLSEQVRALPDKLDTALHPTGLPLSEGRSLALLAARAMLARPRLLVVDGLLDAVPRKFRQELISALTDREAPWTLIVLTEDESMTRYFDRTIQIVDGGLVARPTLRSL